MQDGGHDILPAQNSPKLTETSSEVLALTHQFAKDDCALAKAAGTNLDLILGGQGKWGFGRLRPCYTIHVHHVHHVLVMFFFVCQKVEFMICPKCHLLAEV